MSIFNSSILKNYGSNPRYIQGEENQPEFSLSYNLNYKGVRGYIRQVWHDVDENFGFLPDLDIEPLDDRPVYYYGENAYDKYTELFFERPESDYYLKIFGRPRYFSGIYNIHPYRTYLGDPYLDSLLIVLEKPKGRITEILDHFQKFRGYISDFRLTTDFVDPVTAKPRLKLRIAKIIEDEDEMIVLFDNVLELIKKLYPQPSYLNFGTQKYW